MYQAVSGQNLVKKFWPGKNRGGLSSKHQLAVRSDGRSQFFDIVKPTTKLIFATTMSSPKRPAAPIDRPVAKQRKCGVCGQLGHNRRKCPAAPAATAAPAVDGQVGDGNGVDDVTEYVPPLLLSYKPKIGEVSLIGEVSFMLFLIWKQQEGVGRGTKSLSWLP